MIKVEDDGTILLLALSSLLLAVSWELLILLAFASTAAQCTLAGLLLLLLSLHLSRNHNKKQQQTGLLIKYS
jgi:hypothetical protein